LRTLQPENENLRIQKLHEYRILDTSPEQAFDDIVSLAAQICGTPFALITLVDSDREWFKAKKGITANENPRNGGFCAQTILHQDVMVVSNADNDPRFSTNALVISEPNIRFYAGAPVRTSTGEALGTLCVLDTLPRELSAEQIETLRALARQIATALELRRKGMPLANTLAEAKHTEQLLRISLDMKTLLLNSANVSIISTNEQGIIDSFNRAAQRMLGYSEAEVVGKYTPSLFHDADEIAARADQLSNDLGRTIAPGFEAFVAKTRTGNADEKEWTYIRKDGSRFPAVVSVTALRDAQNAIIGYLLIGTDNTARKQAEEALLKAGALQSAIFNSANFSSIATDAKGVIQIFNVGAERMLGYAAADVMNKITPADISDPQEVVARAEVLSVELGTLITPGFEALVFKASRGIEDIYELTYIRKDGSRFPAVVSVTALRDTQNAIIGYLLIGTDNTARKQVEEERMKLDQRLRDQQFYTRSLLESNIDALMATDPSGIITDVNKQMEVLTGCTRDELIGAPFKNFFTDPERAEAGIKLVLNEKTITDYELTARAKDGKETVVSYNATTFYDRDRTLQGVFAAARDVTERKSANDKLKNALNEKEMLLKEVYHRVKNNLQVVSSLINLQAKNVSNEATLELLKQSADRIKAMALLHEKLYQSKDLTRIDFNEYIHSLVDHLLFSYGGHSGKIKISMSIDEVFFDVDTAIPCGLIINELLSNALQHAFPDDRHGEIGITFTQDLGEFILVITDNGIGFPTDLDYKKSASLGLQLVATLTNQLNGHMALDQTDGSTFTIRFTSTY